MRENCLKRALKVYEENLTARALNLSKLFNYHSEQDSFLPIEREQEQGIVTWTNCGFFWVMTVVKTVASEMTVENVRLLSCSRLLVRNISTDQPEVQERRCFSMENLLVL